MIAVETSDENRERVPRNIGAYEGVTKAEAARQAEALRSQLRAAGPRPPNVVTTKGEMRNEQSLYTENLRFSARGITPSASAREKRALEGSAGIGWVTMTST